MGQPPSVPLLKEFYEVLSTGNVDESGKFISGRNTVTSPREKAVHSPKSPKITSVITSLTSPREKKCSEEKKIKKTSVLSPTLNTNTKCRCEEHHLERQNGQTQLNWLMTANDADLIKKDFFSSSPSTKEKKAQESQIKNPLFQNSKLIKQKSNEKKISTQLDPECKEKYTKVIDDFIKIRKSNEIDTAAQKTELTKKQLKECINYILKMTFDSNLKVINILEKTPQRVWKECLRPLMKKKSKDLSTECPDRLIEPLKRIITIYELLTNGVELVNDTILSSVDFTHALIYLSEQIFSGNPQNALDKLKDPQEAWTSLIKPFFENLSSLPFPDQCPAKLFYEIEFFLDSCAELESKPHPRKFADAQLIRGIITQEVIDINGINFAIKEPVNKFDETAPRDLEQISPGVSSFYSALLEQIKNMTSSDLDHKKTLQNMFKQEPQLDDRNILNVLSVLNNDGWGKWEKHIRILLQPIFSKPWKTIHFKEIADNMTSKLTNEEQICVTLARKYQNQLVAENNSKIVANWTFIEKVKPSLSMGIPDRARVQLADFEWSAVATKKEKKAFREAFFNIHIPSLSP